MSGLILNVKTKFGRKVHGLDAHQKTYVGQYGHELAHLTVCNLAVQRGDKILPDTGKVTCKKCLRIINQEGA